VQASSVRCQQLGGGPRGFVAAEFLKPAISPDGSVAMGPDDSALRAAQGSLMQRTDPLRPASGQPMANASSAWPVPAAVMLRWSSAT